MFSATDTLTRFPRGSELTIIRGEEGDFALMIKEPGKPDKGVGGIGAGHILNTVAWFLLPVDSPIFCPKSESEWEEYNRNWEALLKRFPSGTPVRTE